MAWCHGLLCPKPEHGVPVPTGTALYCQPLACPCQKPPKPTCHCVDPALPRELCGDVAARKAKPKFPSQSKALQRQQDAQCPLPPGLPPELRWDARRPSLAPGWLPSLRPIIHRHFSRTTVWGYVSIQKNQRSSSSRSLCSILAQKKT